MNFMSFLFSSLISRAQGLRRLGAVSALAILLSACGGSFDSSNSSFDVLGSGVKGPLVDSIVVAYELDLSSVTLKGEMVATGYSDSFARLNMKIAVEDLSRGPFLIEYQGGSEITGALPVIDRLQTVVTSEQLRNGEPVYATPLSSLALQLARAALSADPDLDPELVLAESEMKVKSLFGLDEWDDLALMTSAPVVTDEESPEVTFVLRRANELFAAAVDSMVEETDETDWPQNGAAIVQLLGTDLSDGVIDGRSPSGTISQLTRVDDAIETLSADPSTLKIPGTDTSFSDLDAVLVSEADAMQQEVDTPKLEMLAVVSSTPANLVSFEPEEVTPPDDGSNDDDSNDDGSNDEGSNDDGSNDDGSNDDDSNDDDSNDDDSNDDDSNDDDSNDDGSNDDGSNDDGSNDDGSNDDGSNDDGSNDDGSNDDGSNDDGSNDDGSNDDGSNDDGSNDDGSNDDGSNDDGSNDDGSNDDGSNDDGSNDDGSNDDGSNDDGSNDDGSNDDGSNDDGSNDDGSNDDGSNDDGSNDDGSNDDGSNDDGSNDDGSNDDGSNDDGSNDDGSNDDGSNDDGSNDDPDVNTPVNVEVSWVWPTQREDGAPLLAANVDGFELYYYAAGQSGSGTSVSLDATDNDGLVTTHIIEGMETGSYEFAVAAIDTDGNVSVFSDAFSLVIP